MIAQLPILSILIALPFLGSLFILCFLRSKSLIKFSALIFAIINFILSIILFLNFKNDIAGFQFEEKYLWIRSFNLYYHLAIDGISIFFILLTTFLIPICLLASWQNIEKRIKEYFIAFLILESLVLGAFCALDLMLFYLFFEAMLIPMFLIIGIWGGENKIYAAFKFFLYTLAGSIFFLVAIIYVYTTTGTTDLLNILHGDIKFPLGVQKYLWLAMFAAFAIKVPMWPFHTWLPDAHVQAPTAGSMILAGILLKIGGYGFLRFSIPLFPEASIYFKSLIYILSIIAVIYASLVALAQKDMKKLIAYSSVAHMGYVTMGIFSPNIKAMHGAVFQMISHGLVSAALFLCVGVLYDRTHSKQISDFGGVAHKMPNFALIFLCFTMASIGLPGTSGFIGEFITMLGVFSINKIYALLLATAMVLGAAYMLLLYKRVMLGTVINGKISFINDLTAREILIFVPILLLVLIMGIYPSIVTDNVHESISLVLRKISFLIK